MLDFQCCDLEQLRKKIIAYEVCPRSSCTSRNLSTSGHIFSSIIFRVVEKILHQLPQILVVTGPDIKDFEEKNKAIFYPTFVSA